MNVPSPSNASAAFTQTETELLREFCKIDQELKGKKREFTTQRKPLYAQRKNTMEELRNALCETDDECFCVPSTCVDGDPLYVRMASMNQTRPITEDMVRESILNVTEEKLLRNKGDLQKTILQNIRERRTERKSVIHVSSVLPAQLKKTKSKNEIPPAPPRIAQLASTLETTRGQIKQLTDHSQTVTSVLVEKQKKLEQPLSEILERRETRALPIQVPGGHKFYLKSKLKPSKPNITVQHVKTITKEAIVNVFGECPQLTLSNLLERLDALTAEVMARIDDGRPEQIVERLTLDQVRASKRKREVS